jgi:hypothetical protein
MPFSVTEKVRIRHHMGYPNVAPAPSLSAGVPIPLQTMFLLEDAMNRVIAEAEPMVRQQVARLDTLDEDIFQSRVRMQASRVDEITLRKDEPDALEREYLRQAARLSEMLHAPLYPFAARFANINSIVPGTQVGMIGVS